MGAAGDEGGGSEVAAGEVKDGFDEKLIGKVLDPNHGWKCGV